MTRDARSRTVYRCTEAFAIYKDGAPLVFTDGQEVLEGDPILKSHRQHFETSESRVMRTRQIEQATAAPGELRTVTTTPKTYTEGAPRG
jgi:hypothetical protein